MNEYVLSNERQDRRRTDYIAESVKYHYEEREIDRNDFEYALEMSDYWWFFVNYGISGTGEYARVTEDCVKGMLWDAFKVAVMEQYGEEVSDE